MKYNTRLTYRIFLQHAARYKFTAFFVILAIIVGTVANIIGPLLYKRFFDILSQGRVGEEAIAELMHIIFLVLILYLSGWFVWRIAEFGMSYFNSRVMADLADTCFRYLHKHSDSFFENNFVGSLVKRLNRFYASFDVMADKYFWDLLPMFVEVVLISAILFLKKPILGWALLLWMLVFVSVNYYYSLFKLRYDVKRSALDTKATAVLADSIANYSNVSLFNGFEREVKSFGEVSVDLQNMRRLTWDLGHIMNAIQSLLMISLEFVLFYIAIRLWKNNVLTIGDFVLIQAYILYIFHRMWNFGRIIRDLYERLADAEEMTVILDTPHEIVNLKNAKSIRVSRGQISFLDVDFNYHKTRPVLERFTMNIKGGERCALVGPSGAGKSTIVKLLLRVADVTDGKILIDGQDIKQATLKSLRDSISLVPQSPILFHRSLRENIRYGKPDASDEEVEWAAKAAHCHEFIRSFSDAYDTFVGERGVKLSGGERQRVAIARAILRNAPILVLDEATSSLDSESEALIQDALAILMKDKTVVVIAHRLSTIMKMDKILVIDGGRIVEEGTHKDLLKKKKGLYHKLWKYQAGGFIS